MENSVGDALSRIKLEENHHREVTQHSAKEDNLIHSFIQLYRTLQN